MKLIVGLGNPGKEYAITRHNVGFLMVEELARAFDFSEWKSEKKFFGSVSFGQIEHEKTVLLKPETFMNLSGKSVLAVSQFYKIPVQKILVFCDDLDLPFGEIRFREKGSSGGHNGLKSIIETLGTDQFFRLKFGIGNALRNSMDAADFVLQNFSEKERSELLKVQQQGLLKFKELLHAHQF